MINKSMLIACVFLLTSNIAMAEGKKLTAAEIKKVFIGKTCDGYNPIKDKNYKIFTESATSMIHQIPKRTKTVELEITDEGEHCVHLKHRRCGTIHDMGKGVYHKMNDGEHINTLKNFVKGNQL